VPGDIKTFIQSIILEKGRDVESIGQEELRQTTLVKTQLKNKCSNESTSVLQRGQERSDAIEGMIDCRRALVGRMFQTIFHKNSLKRSFKFSFQIAFHKGRVGGDKLVIKMARYAEFVVKQPEQE
jgi:hypothetical protein